MPRIFVTARDALHAFDERGQEVPTQHAGRPVTAVVRDGPELAIVDWAKVWHASEDEWRQVAKLEDVDAICIAMTDAIHVGSSGARLFRQVGSDDPLGCAGRQETAEADERKTNERDRRLDGEPGLLG